MKQQRLSSISPNVMNQQARTNSNSPHHHNNNIRHIRTSSVTSLSSAAMIYTEKIGETAEIETIISVKEAVC